MFASPGAVALHVGRFAIRWYGLIIAAAVMLGTALAQREALRRGQDPEPVLTAIFLGVLSGLAGARLYYVAFNWEYYGPHPAKIFALWEGGLAIHGGLLTGLLAVIFYCRHMQLSALVMTDVLAPGVAIAQAVGRWGNFFNQEAFGLPTSLPWKLYIDPYHRPAAWKDFDFFHPTFLYESVWSLIVFLLLWFGLRQRFERWPGALTLNYLGLYSIGRFFIERLRLDSLMLGPFRAAQLVSLLLVVGSGVGLAAVMRRKP